MPKTGRPTHCDPESGHARIQWRDLADLRPAPENDRLYSPVVATDPTIRALAVSIARHGVKEPLVASQDGFLLSGHRRYAAAALAGLRRVPCRIEPIRRSDDIDKFVVLLREFNRQREKSFAERLREELATVDPQAAYRTLTARRAAEARVDVPPLNLDGPRTRAAITAAKRPMLSAVRAVLDDRRDYWPLSDRQVHYALLNDPPLRHVSKPDSRYANDGRSYHDLTDLLTRARIAGEIPFEALADETRPVTMWRVQRDRGAYLAAALNAFLADYWRDFQRSQPHHIEVVAEKNTIAPVCNRVCRKYRLPLTSGRGFCSLPPRHAMARRFRDSGKSRLVLLLVSDFDPDGEEIAHSFARSLRDDFRINDIHPIKVALTAAQAREFRLPPLMRAKSTSSNHAKFVRRHGHHVWEVEALPPARLEAILDTAIQSVLDLGVFEREQAAEAEDAAYLAGVRTALFRVLRENQVLGE